MSTISVSELLLLSPNDIEIEENVRLDPRLEGEFLASIAEHGVLVPVLAVRIDGQGKPLVREGQRRIQAARQVGLESVPVYVRTVDGSEEAVRARRVIEQIVTNDHRAPLTDAERARGIRQLLLDGVSPAKVAKGLSTTKDVVAAAKVAAESGSAMSALDAGQLTLEEAALFAEFDGDEEAQAVLLRHSGTASFAHRIAQLRIERQDEALRAAAAAEYAARGYTVLDRRPGYFDREYISVEDIWDAHGERLTNERAAAMDPQHWAVWLGSQEAYVDAETGEPVDEEDIDFDTADDPDLEPADDLRHFRSVTETTIWVAQYFCHDLHGAGVRLSDSAARRFGVDAAEVDGDPDEAAERERVRKEQESAERRRVLALNRLGLAAQTVRREWVRDHLLSRSKAPTGTALYLAKVAVTQPDLFNDYHGRHLVPELLGLPPNKDASDAVDKLPASGDGRALVILLGMVLSTAEVRTNKDSWRAPQDFTRDYLHFLEDNGYPLSDIEQVMIGARSADEVYRDQCVKD